MIDSLSLFGDGRYAVKAECLAFDPLLLTMYVAGYSLGILAFFVMSIALFFSNTPEGEQPYTRRLFAWLFLLLSIALGFSVTTFFVPLYHLHAVIVGATGAMAMVTMIFTLKDLLRLEFRHE